MITQGDVYIGWDNTKIILEDVGFFLVLINFQNVYMWYLMIRPCWVCTCIHLKTLDAISFEKPWFYRRCILNNVFCSVCHIIEMQDFVLRCSRHIECQAPKIFVADNQAMLFFYVQSIPSLRECQTPRHIALKYKTASRNLMRHLGRFARSVVKSEVTKSSDVCIQL